MAEKIGHYTILERLGWGALGDVYRARDTKIGRTVALFQPPAHLVTDPDRRARFVEDARIAATLNHPNIAALFDVVEQERPLLAARDEACRRCVEHGEGAFDFGR